MSKDQFEVVRTKAIDAPAAQVFPLIADFHRWTAWSPWEDVDPNLSRTYSGAEAGTGAIYEWTGNRKAGQGRMEILSAQAPELVEIDLQFIKPFKARNRTTFELAESDGSTTVTWRMVGPRSLFTKVMEVFKSMDKMVGPDFEKGLDRLDIAATAR